MLNGFRKAKRGFTAGFHVPLNDHCNCNKLKVNISKTKIMVFARSKTRLNNIPTFKFGNIDLKMIIFTWGFALTGMGRLLRPKNYCMIKLRKLCRPYSVIHYTKKAGD